MWKATIGVKPAVPPKPTADEDDWDTPNFVNDVTEKESRWGAKTVSGSGHQESVRLDELRDEVN
ncbi:SH3 domain-containing protein [Aphelenchoides besseyi]|nr:SH3 domain-containing protein [Aphelenchoides besseyi]